jgi:protoporphyrinogen oxidase
MKTVIIGAGFAGLAAAHRLKKDFLIIEKEARPGGLCRTDEVDGFYFDYTGHFLHLRKPETTAYVKKSGAKLKKVARKARIFSNGVYTEYPYQVNNYGLPHEKVVENITGFLRAKGGGAPSTSNFKEWIMTALGKGIAGNFMLPYNEKLFKYPLEKLTLEWMGRFVPSPSVEDVMRGILPKGREGMGYNSWFYYPKSGGIESVIKALFEEVETAAEMCCEARGIDLKEKAVHCAGGRIEKYDRLITTMPLPEFINLTGDRELMKLASKLTAVSVYCLNIGYKKGRKTGMHWVYVPEEKYPFYRIGFPSEVSASVAPKNCSSVFAEASFYGAPPKGIDGKIIDGLVDMGIIRNKKDIVLTHPMVLKDAYVIYNKEREAVLPRIKASLEKQGVYTAGRWGNWEYSSMEDAILEGFEAADKAGR